MSEPLSKQEMVRLAWITALRRQGHRQCTGTWWNGKGEVCAIGLLAETIGWNPYTDTAMSTYHVMQKSGLSSHQLTEVTLRNDGDHLYQKHTFSEIADIVEGWFK